MSDVIHHPRAAVSPALEELPPDLRVSLGLLRDVFDDALRQSKGASAAPDTLRGAMVRKAARALLDIAVFDNVAAGGRPGG